MKFKIQLPVVSNAPAGQAQALIYNQSRTVKQFVPVTDALMTWFPKGRLRVYVEGRLKLIPNGDGTHTVDLNISRVLHDQCW